MALLAQLVYNVLFCFDPMGSKPHKIVVYKYGEAYTLTKRDPAFDIIYEQLRGEWEIMGGDITRYNSGGAVFGKEAADIFYKSGMVVEVKYRLARISTGVGSTGAKYDTLVFLLDNPKEIPVDIDPFVKGSLVEMISKSYYSVYLTKNGVDTNEAFIFYNYP